ncbi:GNAT family N-acetyltransferase [Methanobacterium alcaliphilum]|uniref:GNAT family N-acetyltransferase n=1 Tax=Methanobacterium alcaliphilum TaxID=392018 RepID=UPI00200A44C7|nr:GNAT family N-acetyltransferase [Methanobacterium alcaliphilum]MCK9152566.1 GNAT family N-acetyltransferase [Methanobacterium alcaliphilum]
MQMKKLDVTKHDTLKVAELIYFTDAHTYKRILKNKAQAISKIEKLVIEGNNSIGYENVFVVTEEDDQVLGVLVVSKDNLSSTRSEIKAFWKVFSLRDTIRFTILDLIDAVFLAKLKHGDFYLACVAVDENCRGLGIGTFILDSALKIARSEGMQKVVLDVDIENKGAKRLYERFGFKIFGKNTLPWINGEKGMFHLEYVI